MESYYWHFNGGAWLVKEGEFFKSQGGRIEAWGEGWTQIYADSAEHARLKAMIITLGGEHVLRRLALEAAR